MIFDPAVKLTGFNQNSNIKMPRNMLMTNASDGSDMLFAEYSKKQMGGLGNEPISESPSLA